MTNIKACNDNLNDVMALVRFIITDLAFITISSHLKYWFGVCLFCAKNGIYFSEYVVNKVLKHEYVIISQ